jgi:Na+/H+ antiporter NhaA
MSLFVAGLSFGHPGDEALLASAKLGILLASLVAGVGGTLVLARGRRARPSPRSRRRGAGRGARRPHPD